MKKEIGSDTEFLFSEKTSLLDRATLSLMELSHMGNEKEALDAEVGPVLNCFHTANAETGFLWWFFSIKRKSKY